MVKTNDSGLCVISCQDCLLWKNNNGKNLVCTQFERKYPEIAITLIQKWSDEHPLPKPKTRLEDFIEKIPNAEMWDD